MGSGNKPSFFLRDPAAAARNAQAVEGGTGTRKLTGLMARPHLELIAERSAVQSEDIPEKGLVVGRDPAREQGIMTHASVSAVHVQFSLKDGDVLLIGQPPNDTVANGIRAESTQLQDGDYIAFARYTRKSLIVCTSLEPQLKLARIDLTKDHLLWWLCWSP